MIASVPVAPMTADDVGRFGAWLDHVYHHDPEFLVALFIGAVLIIIAWRWTPRRKA